MNSYMRQNQQVGFAALSFDPDYMLYLIIDILNAFELEYFPGFRRRRYFPVK